jgi:hypothetical protein
MKFMQKNYGLYHNSEENIFTKTLSTILDRQYIVSHANLKKLIDYMY